jgi:hypothetical protein
VPPDKLLATADEVIEQSIPKAHPLLRLLTTGYGPKRRKSMSASTSAFGREAEF